MTKRTLSVAVLAFLLTPVVRADVPDSGVCSLVQMFGGLPVVETNDLRIMSAVAFVLSKAEVSVPIYVCELVDPSYGPLALTHKILNQKDGELVTAIVIVAQLAAERYSEATFRAMIAHEIAHTKFNSPLGCTVAQGESLPDIVLRLSCETPADALAANWVGVDAVRVMLQDVGRELIPFLKPEHRGYTRNEIAGRIAVLDALNKQAVAP